MLIVDQLRRGEPRLRALAVSMVAGLFILTAGLWYIQIVSARQYQTSLDNQTYRTVRVPGIRGKIFDRNGIVLAENRPSYNLDLYLEELRPLFKKAFTRARHGRHLTTRQRRELNAEVRFAVASNVVARVAQVEKTTVPFSERRFHRHHTEWPYRPMPILEDLDSTQVARYYEQSAGVPGIDLDTQPIRFYPRHQVVAHLLGYLERDDTARNEDDPSFNYSLPTYNGEVGVEYGFNKLLAGKPGIETIVVNSLCYRESENVWVKPEPGENLVLALDYPLQLAAYHALRSVGANVRGAVVILNVNNGDVLAMVSNPTYDPNEFVGPISEARWAQLDDPKAKPMLNRATQGAYPPGSTFKMITALACFEAGLNPQQEFQVQPDPSWPSRSAIYVGRRKIRDLAPPGEYDFVRAFKRSSNSYFIHYGLLAGLDRVLDMGRRFFLGQRIGLRTRQEVSGYFPTPAEIKGLWVEGNLANVCIGQEITVTPLQMAVVTAAIANGGRVFRPRLVLRSVPAEPGLDDAQTTDYPPKVRGVVHEPAAWFRLIRRAMLADAEQEGGTAFHVFNKVDRRTGRIEPRIPGFRIGGKTGTAEIKEHGRVVDKITWFVSFAPYAAPHYAVVVMVQNGTFGGTTCGPVARQIYRAIQQRMRAGTATDNKLAKAD